MTRERYHSDPDWRFLQSRQWRQRVRLAQLSREPLCEFCQQLGRVTVATSVDHIERPKGDKWLQTAQENLRSLCMDHHARKSAWERGDQRRPLTIGIDPNTGYSIELRSEEE